MGSTMMQLHVTAAFSYDTIDCTTNGYSRNIRLTNALVVIPRAVSLQN